MRLDHVAYRVKDREKTAKFFMDALGYKIQERFTIDFDDGTCAECIALEPPEKLPGRPPWLCGESHFNSTTCRLKSLSVTEQLAASLVIGSPQEVELAEFTTWRTKWRMLKQK